jgi:hydrogenase maturation factor
MNTASSTDPSALSPDPHPGEVCITCSDMAVPVTVTALLGDGLAMVDTGAGPGTEEEVSVALVDAGVGDTVLVHAGEAIVRVEPPGQIQHGSGSS